MQTQRPDVIQMLTDEKKWHEQQIEQINIALDALQNKKPKMKRTTIPPEKIPWTAEILQLFEEHGQLKLEDIRRLLAEKGIKEALEDKRKPVIYNTVIRSVEKGKLEKISFGTYRKKIGTIQSDFGLLNKDE